MKKNEREIDRILSPTARNLLETTNEERTGYMNRFIFVKYTTLDEKLNGEIINDDK